MTNRYWTQTFYHPIFLFRLGIGADVKWVIQHTLLSLNHPS